MTNDEALKINGLYAQIDQLTVENNTLKSTSNNDHDNLLTKLSSIEVKLDKLLVDKGKTK
tara:strand:- start:122 stop:301 length:180 start_codon:yes stop_codon:yes gene_type:complete